MEAMNEMEDVTSLEGPVTKKDGVLTLLVRLVEGGLELMECSRGISEIEGACLKIEIPEWLAGVLRVKEGDLININNLNGKFNISAVSARPMH